MPVCRVFEILPRRFWAVAFGFLLALLSAHVSLAVTINVDSSCELPDAIKAANNDSNSHNANCTAGSGADTINLSGMSSPYTMTAAFVNITSNITIAGAGKTVSGNDSYRIFNVQSGGKLTIDNITLTNGNAINTTGGGGGGINVDRGSATISNSTIKDSRAINGGAIEVDYNGVLTIIGSTIKDNRTRDLSFALGGGLHFRSGKATIINSTFSGNHANDGGGAIDLQAGNMTIENSSFLNNTALSSRVHDGISVRNQSIATLSHVTIYNGNLAIGGEPTVYLRNSILSDDDDTDNTVNCYVWGGDGVRQNVGNLISKGSSNCTSTHDNAHMGSEQTGPPPYFLPQANSEALGIGDAAICRRYAQDKLGYYRPANRLRRRLGRARRLQYHHGQRQRQQQPGHGLHLERSLRHGRRRQHAGRLQGRRIQPGGDGFDCAAAGCDAGGIANGSRHQYHP